MKSASRPVASVSFLLGLLFFVAFACNFPGYQASAPTLELSEAGGTVTGSYPLPGEAGAQVVSVTPQRVSLESIFLHAVEEGSR